MSTIIKGYNQAEFAERNKLVEKLKSLTGGESDHIAADQALLDYINDPEITALYNRIQKWYA